MIGALANGAGIALGALVGLWTDRQLSPARQRQLQVLLGAFTVFAGLSLAWNGLRGPPAQFFGKLVLMLVTLMLGKLTGQWLRIQSRVNGAGVFAQEQLQSAAGADSAAMGRGFPACAAVYCLAPLAVLGALAEGLQSDLRPLGLKTVMDALAAVTFARAFRWGAVLSAVPVVVWEGTLTLGSRLLQPVLEQRLLLDNLVATTGFLVFAVALVILRLRRIELADYYPSLIYAPLLAMAFR